jgi:hypothetical protein
MKDLKLEWGETPIKTTWGPGMMEALIEINKDETASIYVHKDAIAEFEQALGKYFLKNKPEVKIMDGIEEEIRDKGLNAPRVTPADVEANIKDEYYFTAADGAAGAIGAELYPATDDEIGTMKTVEVVKVDPALNLLTFCVLVLQNGFTVTGESACASPENFDAEVGRKIARQNAVSKVWSLMGYELKSKLNANKMHLSDCSVHNEPYMPNGECDCK